MAHTLHAIWRLARLGEREEAIRQLVEAYIANGAVQLDTSRSLGIDQTTFIRWVRKLGCRDQIRQAEIGVIQSVGKAERRGRPLGSRDIGPRKARKKKKNVRSKKPR